MRFLKKKTTINPNDFITASGSRKKKVLSPFYDGRKFTLIESGEVDIQDQINSHSIECDINYILSRLAHGDMSAINPKSPVYADFHNLPTNFREVLHVGLNAQRIFDTLPVDVRKRFDNDYRQFVSKSGTEEWYNLMRSDNEFRMDSSPDSKPMAGSVSSVDKKE